jgi:hypothetical protein
MSKDVIEKEQDLKALVEADKKKRVAECGAGLEEILKKHNCTLVAHVILSTNSVTPQIVIQALD